MAMVNMNNLLNGKDSRWLQLEVCREFQRNKCTRPDTECKFAHPPANVEVQNGRVTACYDSIKGRCNREKPPCKYFHPPQHLKDQLLINGRNHLALKNALMQQMGLAPGGQPLVPGQVPAAAAAVVGGKVQFATSPLTLGQPLMMHAEGQSYNHNPIFITATNPYLTGMPQVGSTFSPYFTPAGPIMPVLPPDPASAAAAAAAAAAVASSSSLAVVPQTMVAAAQKMPRSDRLEVCREYQRGACKRAESECRFAHPPDTVVTASEDGGITVTVCMDAVKGRCNRDPCRYFHPPLHLQAHIKAAAQSRASTAHVPVSVATVGSVEVGKKRARDPSDDILLMDMKSVGSFYYDNFAFPGMVPYKRPAADKSGVPVYQPNATTYQQLMQLQQPFVPVSCEYSSAPSNTSNSLAPSIPTSTANPSPPPPTAATIAHSVHDEGGGSNQVVAATQKMQNSGTETGLANVGRPPGGVPPPPANRQAFLKAARRLTPVTSTGSVVSSSTSSASSVSSSSSSSPSPMSLHHLNALNFTGVALNKQQPMQAQSIARFPPPTMPNSNPYLGPVTNLTGYRAMLGTQLSHPQLLPQALLSPQNAFPPRPASSPFLQPSYALVGHQQPEQSQPMNALLAQYAQMAAAGNANSILAAAMGLQPYKKMRTS
ncbi:muscleblind-like protein 2a isoform X3 [Ischnura elegans]|uniref:muscleblind-like protein 2a isoform X3 n=1 Tax=Ischnura elegans TaxID=197161 RepID=UPI001ED86D4C|nr:muscleblind-like protein 2a isoform X3 [Ischnura elegans]